MSNSNESGNTPPGGRFGNSGVVAHKAGLKDWRPGDDIPEHYIVYAVSAEEVCKYCDALKAELDSYAGRGILTYEVKRLTTLSALQAPVFRPGIRAFLAEHDKSPLM